MRRRKQRMGMYIGKYTVVEVFRTFRVFFTTDLVAVKGFKEYTIVDEETFKDLLSRSTAPIVLHEDYIAKDEKGRIIYE